MSILVDFNNISERLHDFESAQFQERYSHSPLLRGLAYTLIAMEWEGTPELLSDAFIPGEKDVEGFESTLTRLGYQCRTTKQDKATLEDIGSLHLPCFIELDKLEAVLMSVENGQGTLFDYKNNNSVTIPLEGKAFSTTVISEYSKLFREPPPESQDKSNWIKYAFYRYNDEFKSLVFLSLVINIFGALQPFFIMSVYNFALASSSEPTLYWLTLFAVFLGFAEYAVKKVRMNILATSGQDLAVHISRNVISKLLWLPYSMTSSAGVSSQLARLKDIDQFRKLVTAEATLSYFDMPFIVIFILAVTILSGYAALTVLAGILLMIVFCIYSRYIYSQATANSSRANAMVSYQWNELLRGINTIQGLPLLRVIQSRFNASHEQSSNDAAHVAMTNSKIQAIGGGLIQAIGTASIVTAVITVMDGNSDAGAMLATVILVWKALGPIMGIYNSITKFQTIKSSAAQINALMSLNDDKTSLEKSPPIRKFYGEVVGSGITHRYQGAQTGLTNLGFKLAPGSKTAISGPAGSGKTTLLMVIAGLEERYQGAVYIDGYNIKQFNNFRYRKAINFIPFDMHLFEGSIRSNYVLHNGVVSTDQMLYTFKLLELHKWFPDGLDSNLNTEVLKNMPSGVIQRLRIAIGLGDMSQNLFIIDEPFVGVENEHASYLNRLFSGALKDKTVVYTTMDPALITSSTHCLLLEPDGNQKYFGLPDKVMATMG
ncbi:MULTISPECIES: ATP-binding cassette domain-containing protein [Vibrio]|nr:MULTISPECIES: ATP-binding cassette domain-containing protein [Vibrio]USD61911.1 ATP-binding cassette domain-containing protein [Vibrio sp. SCSIO 43140]